MWQHWVSLLGVWLLQLLRLLSQQANAAPLSQCCYLSHCKPGFADSTALLVYPGIITLLLCIACCCVCFHHKAPHSPGPD